MIKTITLGLIAGALVTTALTPVSAADLGPNKDGTSTRAGVRTNAYGLPSTGAPIYTGPVTAYTVPDSWFRQAYFGVRAEAAFGATRHVDGKAYDQIPVYGLLQAGVVTKHGFRVQGSAGLVIPTMDGKGQKTTGIYNCSCYANPRQIGEMNTIGTYKESLRGIAMLDVYTPTLVSFGRFDASLFIGGGAEFAGNVTASAMQSGYLYNGRASFAAQEIARAQAPLGFTPFVQGGLEVTNGRVFGRVTYRHTFGGTTPLGAFGDYRQDGDSVLAGVGINFSTGGNSTVAARY